MINILEAQIHDLNKSTARVDAFAANMSLTTSFQGFSQKDA